MTNETETRILSQQWLEPLATLTASITGFAIFMWGVFTTTEWWPLAFAFGGLLIAIGIAAGGVDDD